MNNKSEEKTLRIKEVVLHKKENIIYVDFVLPSMVKSVENWYTKYYQHDYLGTARKAHVFHLIRFYDFKIFNNCKTLEIERNKYLEKIDLYVQMRRDD